MPKKVRHFKNGNDFFEIQEQELWIGTIVKKAEFVRPV
jgi:hypothetical protein